MVEMCATTTVEQLEEQIQTAGQQSMRQAMQQGLRAWEEEHRECPRCQQRSARLEGTVRRHLQTLFGPVEVPMRRFRCLSCWHRYGPVRSLLAPLQQGRVTRPLKEAAVLAGASWSYREAAQVLHRLCGASLSGEQIRLLTNRAGKKRAEQQQEAAQRSAREPGTLAPVAHQPESQAVIGMDGGWVGSREQRGEMEGKGAVIATDKEVLPRRPPVKPPALTWYELAKRKRSGRSLSPTAAVPRARWKRRQYVATFASSQHLGVQAAAAASQMGIDRQTAVVVADGAEWIKQETQKYFPQATPILDWPHLWRVVGKALCSMKMATNQSERWMRQQSEQLRAWLWKGEVEPVLQRLRSWQAEAGPTAADKAIQTALVYLEHQRGWIGSYAHWKQLGYPVGSGIIERAVALVINRRMKKRGMRWNRSNATAMVALWVSILNADWQHAPPARFFP